MFQTRRHSDVCDLACASWGVVFPDSGAGSVLSGQLWVLFISLRSRIGGPRWLPYHPGYSRAGVCGECPSNQGLHSSVASKMLSGHDALWGMLKVLLFTWVDLTSNRLLILQKVYLLKMIIKILRLLHRTLYFLKCSQVQYFTPFAMCSCEAIIPVLEGTSKWAGYLNSKGGPSEVKERGLEKRYCSLLSARCLLVASGESGCIRSFSSLKPQAAFRKPALFHLDLPPA